MFWGTDQVIGPSERGGACFRSSNLIGRCVKDACFWAANRYGYTITSSPDSPRPPTLLAPERCSVWSEGSSRSEPIKDGPAGRCHRSGHELHEVSGEWRHPFMNVSAVEWETWRKKKDDWGFKRIYGGGAVWAAFLQLWSKQSKSLNRHRAVQKS